jgi:CheY-like chemotaxis protein
MRILGGFGVSDEIRVLVVDDHPVNRLVLSEILMHFGCDVSTAEDGALALDVAAAGGFDLICLDRHMPGLSGDEVAAALPPDQFVLAWSTDLTDLPKRFNGVMSKPVTLAAAERALQRALAWRSRQTAPARRGAAA